VNSLDEELNDRGVGKGGDISKGVLLSGENLSQDSSHDLSGSGLGKVRDDVDHLGGGEGTDGLANLGDEVLAKLGGVLESVLDGDEGVDSLSGKLIGDTDDGGLSDSGVVDQGSLDLSGGETVTGNVDNVVNTSADPVVSLVVTGSSVSREVVSLVDVQVGVHVALVSTPDGTGHRGPGLAESQNSLDVVSDELLTRDGVDNAGVDSEEGEGSRSGLGGSASSEGSDNV
jgi:hypothetical protein